MTLPTGAEHPGASALVDSVTADVLAVLDTIGAPTERALAAWRAIEATTALREKLVEARQVAFSTLYARGMSYPQLGERFGISAARARQITTGERR